ncbi:hypothetical protein [Amycolatopsis pithecellobii]|uniref:DUF1616 domain-containing protein n=1 Tax=Amycolatopsis pithecellobii TaxID=664692 RepID=A0A6N7YVN1_9PSEU|nr:hypothetical protein [Amycolatopsis pithecellobii]MTD57125.1 hypothetical protein [Amycolatopsis pithecellobii]
MAEQLRIRRITAYCLLGICVLTALLITLDLDTPVRTIAVLLFLGTAPGWALISYVNVRHLSVTWISAVGLSLSAGLIVAQLLVLTHAWHPEAAVLGMVVATAALLVHHVLRSRPRSVP